MAVRIAAGLGVANKMKPPNLSAMRKWKRLGRKQGRKRGLDSIETSSACAPDSAKAKQEKVNVRAFI